jgi:hypothetical protein
MEKGTNFSTNPLNFHSRVPKIVKKEAISQSAADQNGERQKIIVLMNY